MTLDKESFLKGVLVGLRLKTWDTERHATPQQQEESPAETDNDNQEVV